METVPKNPEGCDKLSGNSIHGEMKSTATPDGVNSSVGDKETCDSGVGAVVTGALDTVTGDSGVGAVVTGALETVTGDSGVGAAVTGASETVTGDGGVGAAVTGALETVTGDGGVGAVVTGALETVTDEINTTNKDEEISERNLLKDPIPPAHTSMATSNTSDPFYYLKRDEFTSEVFKIEIEGLPRKLGFGQIKKKLRNMGLNPHKVKCPQLGRFAFITFRCQEDREKALKVINGYEWKGTKLQAKEANPSADPLLMKRKLQQDSQPDGQQKVAKRENLEDESLSFDDRLKNVVTPLWNMPYEEQLKKKMSDMEQVLKNFCRQIDKECPELRPWLQEQKKQHDWKCCELLPIKPSPVTEGYRNKCEFTVGMDPRGTDNTCGFRFSSYKAGTVCVWPPTEVAVIPLAMKNIVKSFQDFIQASKYGAFNPETHGGHWRQLAVRTSRGGDVMAMADFHPQQLAQEEMDEERNRLQEYFMSGKGSNSGITSLFFRLHSERITGTDTDSPYQHLLGNEYIHEELNGLRFRISPDAFFQVNAAAAEVLYNQVTEWCNVSPSTTILDICCGTGTIGLSMAKKVKKVIGVEMCQQAVDDAKENAILNGITNVEFYCSKAEDVIADIMGHVRSSDVVAVVDPPRNGLHSKVLQAIRKCPHLNKLVYVACKPQATHSYLDLIRKPSKRLKGSPFKPIRAVPVDLFPHTRHCELVMLFERDTEEDTT